MTKSNHTDNREAYGLIACTGLLFNRDPPRCSETFGPRKITRDLANIAQSLMQCIYMGDMDSLRIWSHAKDRMQLTLLLKNHPKNLVMATGVQQSAHQLFDMAVTEPDITLAFEGVCVAKKAMVQRVGITRPVGRNQTNN